MVRGWLLVAAAIALTAPACTGGECKDGTVRYGDTCVLVDPFDKTPPAITVDPPLYTREVGTATLTSDKPATIYYTIDGSSPTLDSPHDTDRVVITGVPDNAQLRYFAVDLNGNRSPEQLWIWVIDRDGPAAPTDFKLALAGTTRTVTWTPTTDPRPGGVLVARVEGRLASAPAGGKAYAVGDTVSPGITVVASSGAQDTTLQTFSESLAVKPGLVRYVAWEFDSLHNYGPPAGDYTLIALPPQTATVAVTGGGTVTVTTPPSNLTLTGSATLTGTTLAMKLSLRNDTTRVLFAPKIVLTSGLTGVTWSSPDGTFGGSPYRSYGPAIAPGTTATMTWSFDGASANTSLTLGVEVHDGYVLTATMQDYQTHTAGAIVDAATGAHLIDLAATPTGEGGGAMSLRGGITLDGRVIAGSRTSGTVSSFDIITGQRQLVTTLRGQKAHTPQVVLDRSGSTAYALVADGHPEHVNNYSGAGSETELVRLDTSTLTESGRLALGKSRNRSIDLSPDGKSLLVSTGLTTPGVLVIDLATFTIKTSLVTSFRPQVATYSPDGTKIAVVGEQIQIFGVGGDPIGTAIATPGTSLGKVVRAVFGPNNTLWVGRRGDVAKIDLTAGTPTELTGYQGSMLEIFDGKVYTLTSAAPQHLVRLDAITNAAEATLAGFARFKGHWIGRSPF